MSNDNSRASAATPATAQNSSRQCPALSCMAPRVGPTATAPKMHRFMIMPVTGIFFAGQRVTSGGTAAMSIRLVHSPCTMKAPTNTAPVGAQAASTDATTNSDS